MTDQRSTPLTDEELDRAAVAAAANVLGTPQELLHEWFQWWWNADDAPASMPRALHVRTALVLGVDLGSQEAPDRA